MKQGKTFFQNRNDRIAAGEWKPVRTINKDKFFGTKKLGKAVK